MSLHFLKVLLSLFFAVWVTVIAWCLFRGDDDNWPPGGAAA